MIDEHELRTIVFNKIREIAERNSDSVELFVEDNYMDITIHSEPREYRRFFKWVDGFAYFINDDKWELSGELLNSLFLLAHADFSDLKRDEVPQELEAVRPKGVKRYYAFYHTLRLISPERIDEVIFLEDLLKEGTVYTADAWIADKVVNLYNAEPKGMTSEVRRYINQYKESIARVNTVDDIPLYEGVLSLEGMILPVISNEFMFL